MIFCCSRKKPKRSSAYKKLLDFKDLFEEDSVKLAVLINQSGRPVSIYRRGGLLQSETDTLLKKIVQLKQAHSTVLNLVESETCCPLHVQGQKVGVSLYSLPDRNLLGLVIEMNPNLLPLNDISKSEEAVQAKIKELY